MYGSQLLTSRGPTLKGIKKLHPQLFENRQPSKFFASKCISFGPSKSKGTSEKPEGELCFGRFFGAFFITKWLKSNPEICIVSIVHT